MTRATDLWARLSRHEAADASERDSVRRIQELLETAAEPFSRRQPEGHVTGSAMVLGPDGRALLLHHARLGLWVQPGGHVEDGESPEAAALREAREESGLADLVVVPDETGVPMLLDIDVHPIPANTKRAEPAHHHHDVCLLLTTGRPETARFDPDESRAMRWVDADAAALLPLDGATVRRLGKAFSWHARGRGSKTA